MKRLLLVLIVLLLVCTPTLTAHSQSSTTFNVSEFRLGFSNPRVFYGYSPSGMQQVAYLYNFQRGYQLTGEAYIYETHALATGYRITEDPIALVYSGGPDTAVQQSPMGYCSSIMSSCGYGGEHSISHCVNYIQFLPIWHGGFRYYRAGNTKRVEAYYIDNQYQIRKKEWSITLGPSPSIIGFDSLMSGSPVAPIAPDPSFCSNVGNGVVVFRTGQAYGIRLPDENFCTMNSYVCWGGGGSLLLLEDGRVPVYGSAANVSGNYIPILGIGDTSFRSKFSCAGPVVHRDGAGGERGVLPPACGVRDVNGVTVAFGTFSPIGSLRHLPSNVDPWRLSSYARNNRAMVFQTSGQVRVGSDVRIAVTADWSSPLTVTVPGLTVTPSGSRPIAVVYAVVRTDTGEVAIVQPGQPIIGQSVNLVIPADIVSAVVSNGGGFVVRAVAVTDAGQAPSPRTVFYHQRTTYEGGGFATLHEIFTVAHPLFRDGGGHNWYEHVKNGNPWLTPTALSVGLSESIFRPNPNDCSDESLHHFSNSAAVFNYRYAADVAQASVSFIPVEVRVNGNPRVGLSFAPDFPGEVPKYFGLGETVHAMVDVPARARLQFDFTGLTATYRYTITTASGTTVYSGTTTLAEKEVRGLAYMPVSLPSGRGGFLAWAQSCGTTVGGNATVQFSGDKHVVEMNVCDAPFQRFLRPPRLFFSEDASGGVRPRGDVIGHFQFGGIVNVPIDGFGNVSITTRFPPVAGRWNVIFREETR